MIPVLAAPARSASRSSAMPTMPSVTPERGGSASSQAISARLAEWKLTLHPEKTKIDCKDVSRRGDHSNIRRGRRKYKRLVHRPRAEIQVRPHSSCEAASFCALIAMPWQQLSIGSRVTREGHARFWEQPEVKLLRLTRQAEPQSSGSPAKPSRRCRPDSCRYSEQLGALQQCGSSRW
jgi:hypothetical protein